MGGIGGPELFLVLVVVLLVFGPKKIPEVARGLGKGLREFRKLSTDFQREINLSAALEEEEKRAAAAKPGPAGIGTRPSAIERGGVAGEGAAASAAPASGDVPAEPESAGESPDPGPDHK